MAKSKRKDGYYWVLYNRTISKWRIVQWSNETGWAAYGSPLPISDDIWDEIGPRIPDYKPKKKAKSQTP